MYFKWFFLISCVIQLVAVVHSQYYDEIDEEECISNDYNPCEADLSLGVDMQDTFIYGSQDLIQSEVTIENHGPNRAHNVKFLITLPNGLNFHSTENLKSYEQIADPSAYTSDENSYKIQFDIDRSLAPNNYVFFVVSLIRELNNSITTQYHISMEVISTTADSALSNNVYEIDINSRIEVDLNVKGWSVSRPIIYKVNDVAVENAVNESQIGPEVEITYQICNSGRTPFDEVVTYFLWQNKTVDGEPLFYRSKSQREIYGNVQCDPAIDVTEFTAQWGEERTESILENVTTGETSSITPLRDSLQLDDAELRNFLSCPQGQCGLIRCTIVDLGRIPCELVSVRMRVVEQTMQKLGLTEIATKAAAMVSKASFDVPASQKSLKVGELKFNVLPFLEVTFMITSNHAMKKYIVLGHKFCNLRYGYDEVVCKTIDVCLTKNGTSNVPGKIGVDVSWILDTNRSDDPRMFFKEYEGKNVLNGTIELDLETDIEHCFSKDVYVASEIRDEVSPIEYEIHLNVRDTSDPPIAKIQQTIIHDAFHIVEKCGSEVLCVPNLRISAEANSEYILGSTDLLEIEIMVENIGEDADEPTIFITIPAGVKFYGIRPSSSNYSSTTICISLSESPHESLKCYVDNPLMSKSINRFKLLFLPLPEEGMSHTYTFNMTVNSTNPEVGIMNDDNYFSLEIPFRFDTKLSLESNTIDQPIQYRSSDYVPLNDATITDSEIGPQVVSIYEIRNAGITPVKEVELFFSWPFGSADGKPLLYLMEQPRTSKNMHCEWAYGDNVFNVHLNRTLIPQIYRERLPEFESTEERIGWRGGRRYNYTCMRRHSIDIKVLNQLTFNGSESCIIRCTTTTLESKSTAWIAVYMRIVAHTVDSLTQNGPYNLSTKAAARISKVAYLNIEPPRETWKVSEMGFRVIRESESVFKLFWSGFLKQLKSFPVWLITLAACISLFIFGISIYLLYKCGFY